MVFEQSPFPPRSIFSHDLDAASGGQSLVPFSSPTVVPTSVVVVTTLSDGLGSVASAPSHGHSVNEDAEPLEPTP